LTTDRETEPGVTAPECLVCPLCMGIAALRQSRPEAVEHVVKAGVELLAAFRSLVEPADGGTHGHRPRAGGVQRIDIG
jgi:hypothetical protein